MKMQDFFDFLEKLKFQDFSSEFDLILSLYKSIARSSTSYPGGNQVDGLPPEPSNAAVQGLVPDGLRTRTLHNLALKIIIFIMTRRAPYMRVSQGS